MYGRNGLLSIIIHMLQNGFVVIFQLLNPEALKKPRNKRILYITFLFHIKTNHTRIIVAVIRFYFSFYFALQIRIA